MIANCSNGTEIYIFEYMDLAEPGQMLHPESIILYILEVAIIICSFVLIFLILRLIFYQPQWHKNLQILMGYFIGGGIPVLFCRMVFIYHELTDNFHQTCKPVLIVATFIRLQYSYAVMHAALALIVERSAAYIFLKDYEKKRRRFIPITVLIFQIGLSAAISVINMGDAFEIQFVCGYMLLIAVISLVAFTCLWQLNLHKFRRIGISARAKDYSLSKRFQLTENLRAFQSIRNVEFACVVMLVIVGALGYNALRVVKTAVGIQLFEISMSCIPMILSLSLLLSAKKWMAFILSRVRPAVQDIPRSIQANEGQLYFNQLNKAWSKKK